MRPFSAYSFPSRPASGEERFAVPAPDEVGRVEDDLLVLRL